MEVLVQNADRSGQKIREMILGVLLPHTKLYGGVKRFLELGNIFVKMGHRFIVFTPDAAAPTWFDFKGEMASFDSLAEYSLDAIWTTTVRYIPMMLEMDARHKIFYHVRKSEDVKEIMKNPEIEVFACSSNVLEYDQKKFHKDVFPAVGGVTVANYRAKTDYEVKDRPFVVLAYGRLAERVKGTKYAVSACERLYKKGYNVKLLLYDTPTSEKAQRKIDKFTCKCPYEFILNHPFDRNYELFTQADCFISAENPKYSGWNNTVAEAMACGVPVISTIAGTRDLITDGENALLSPRRRRSFTKRLKVLYGDAALRKKLGTNARNDIMNFDWENLATRIIAHLESSRQ